MNPDNDIVQTAFKAHIALAQNLSDTHVAVISDMATKIVDCLKAGGKILWCGNGGSAADAQHLAAELVGRFKEERGPLPSIALTVDTSILTCVGNDYGYDFIFSRYLGSVNSLSYCGAPPPSTSSQAGKDASRFPCI